MMSAIAPIDILRQNLELAKEQLKNVDSDIKRITGRDPTEDRYLRRIADGGNRRFSSKPNLKPGIVRGVLLSPDIPEKQKIPEDDLQVSLASSVVCVNDSRSRLDASKTMRKSDKDRGKRMLGILQGTLNQFRKESAAATNAPQMAKRRQVDARLEARAEQEKERLRKERAELFRCRREQQLEVALLQQKMRIFKGFEAWKAEMEKMIGFCRTETKPAIYFRPKVENDETKRRVQETAQVIHELIKHRQRKLDLGFEETATLRRRQFASQSEPNQFDDVDADDTRRPLRDWSSPQKPNTQNSSVHSLGNTQSQITVGGRTKTQKLRSNSTAPADFGELSDASETFAIGDEEPLLMEEEHLPANNGQSPARDKFKARDKHSENDPFLSAKVDTRTVRVSANESAYPHSTSY
ncbi:hypothetical protein EG68_11147 [Paragonimus skrjabini miyazakii]|uniref:Pinin n=1 Tax=Paragonimus skrjabini miyazakii TaxID=59628 RepID=A0A8S9YJC0_9TREM|nr:hypothetical protein EG68_11147 [Paragonimus skrjabini miyazakii]